jgi:hypothetical protein
MSGVVRGRCGGSPKRRGRTAPSPLVLRSPSDTSGVDNLDFVAFPPRWLVMKIPSVRGGMTAMLPVSSWA